jgi:rRNA maturation RNase YbeY
MGVALSCRTPRGAPWQAYLRARARQIERALALGCTEISLALVDDAEMRALNRAYRGVDRTTDVLAFPLREKVDGSAARGRGVARARAACGAPRPDGLAAHLSGGGPAARLLGDVVISIDTAAAQARVGHVPLAARLDVLLIHGVLHLLGYDHEVSAAEARRMARHARALRAVLAVEPSLTGRSGARGRPVARRSRIVR